MNIPPETIKVGVLHEEIPNPMREYYNQGVTQGMAFAIAKFKDILERLAQNTVADALVPSPRLDEVYRAGAADMEAEPPSQTVVRAGTELIDNAMHDLLNHSCLNTYSDYLTIGMIEKWLGGKGAIYLAALVNAVLEAQR